MTFGGRLRRQKRYQAHGSSFTQPVAEPSVVPQAAAVSDTGRWARALRLPRLAFSRGTGGGGGESAAREQAQSEQTLTTAGPPALSTVAKQTAACAPARSARSSRFGLWWPSWFCSNDGLSTMVEGMAEGSSGCENPTEKDPQEVQSRALLDDVKASSTEKDACLWRLVSLMYEQSLNDDELASLLESCPEVRWIAQCASRTPLPPGWRKDSVLRLFVCDATGTVSHTPPNIAQFVQLARLAVRARQVPQEAFVARKWVESMMQEAIKEAGRIADEWSGPHVDAESGAEYYHCPTTRMSCWENPSAGNAFLACVAHRLLQSEAFPDDAQRSSMPVPQQQPNAETLFLAGLAAHLLHRDPTLTGQTSTAQQCTAMRLPLEAATERVAKRSPLIQSAQPCTGGTTAMQLMQASELQAEEQRSAKTASMVLQLEDGIVASPEEEQVEQPPRNEEEPMCDWLSKELGPSEEIEPTATPRAIPTESVEAKSAALAEEDRWSCWSFGDGADVKHADVPLSSSDTAEDDLMQLKSLLAPPVSTRGDTIESILAELAEDGSEAAESDKAIPPLADEKPQTADDLRAFAKSTLFGAKEDGRLDNIFREIQKKHEEQSLVADSSQAIEVRDGQQDESLDKQSDERPAATETLPKAAAQSLTALPSKPPAGMLPLVQSRHVRVTDGMETGSCDATFDAGHSLREALDVAPGSSTLAPLLSRQMASKLAPLPFTPAMTPVSAELPKAGRLPSFECIKRGGPVSSSADTPPKPATVKVERWPCATPFSNKRYAAPTKLAEMQPAKLLVQGASTAPTKLAEMQPAKLLVQGADTPEATRPRPETARPRASLAGPGWQPPPHSPLRLPASPTRKAGDIKRAVKGVNGPSTLAPFPGSHHGCDKG